MQNLNEKHPGGQGFRIYCQNFRTPFEGIKKPPVAFKTGGPSTQSISMSKRVFSLCNHKIGNVPSQFFGVYQFRFGVALQAHHHDFLLIAFGE